MSGLAIQTAARAMAYRSAMNAMRGGVRKPRYKLPSWLTYANVAGAWKASRSARARLGTYRRKLNKTLFGSRKRAQGQARLAAQGKKRKITHALVPAKKRTAAYAIAPNITKFKKPHTEKVQKPSKYVTTSYRDFGTFAAEKNIWYINEHHGSVDRFWYQVAAALIKPILAKAKIYPGKHAEDPMIGPSTRLNIDDGALHDQYEDVNRLNFKLRLLFCHEQSDGGVNSAHYDFALSETATNPDQYYSLHYMSTEVAAVLKAEYNGNDPSGLSSGMVADTRRWLKAAQIFDTDYPDHTAIPRGLPITVDNLDDSMICYYSTVLMKTQNVTPADGLSDTAGHGTALGTKLDIGANPLTGRLYRTRGIEPKIDSDLMTVGNKTFDEFFRARDSKGLTFLNDNSTYTGATAMNATDLGRIQHIPHGRALFSASFKEGKIHMPAGSMKFDKTTFALKTTWRKLADYFNHSNEERPAGPRFGSNTLCGLALEHRHGVDQIKIGWERDTRTSAYCKLAGRHHMLKTQFTSDVGDKVSTIVPADLA